MAVSHYTFWKITTSAAFLAVLILILIFEKDFERQSGEFSAKCQQEGGENLKLISQIFSTPLVYWIVLYLLISFSFCSDIRFQLYMWTCILIPMTVCYLVRPVFYHPRPFAISRDVQNCECDPGMPSGHITVSSMGYFVVYQFTKRSFSLS